MIRVLSQDNGAKMHLFLGFREGRRRLAWSGDLGNVDGIDVPGVINVVPKY